ncbi:MAG: SGNH/GDSL hydrolase family protein [Myxococcota bacterium]
MPGTDGEPAAAERFSRGLLGRLGLLAGSLCFSLLLAEVVLRFALPWLPETLQDQIQSIGPGLRQSGIAHDELHEPDDRLGYRMRASVSAEIQFRRDLPPTRVTTNAAGFRSSEGTRAPIVVVGDSFAFGYGVEDEEVSAVELSRLLQMDVACLGVTGYGTHQYNRVLYDHGLSLQPDLVLYYLFLGNDFAGAQPPESEPFTASPDPSIKERLRDFMSAKSMSFQLLKFVLGANVYSYGHRIQTEDLDLYLYLDNSPYNLERPTIRDAFEIVMDNIRRARRRAREAGAETLVVLIPTKESVYRHLAAPHLPESDFFEAEDELRRRVLEVLDTEAARSLDLTPALRERAIGGKQLYHVFDGHWSPAGNRAAAEIIHDYLERETPVAALR